MNCALLTNYSNIPDALLKLPRVTTITTEFEMYVLIDEQGISLLIPKISKNPYRVDFESDQMLYRSNRLLEQNELIVRACRIKALPHSAKILDATAGFSKDGYLLAVSGFQVHLLERNPIIAALVADGLARLSNLELRQRITLTHQNSIDYLTQPITENNRPDVIYLDPMFHITRHAKVKKDLQILQALLPKNEIDDEKLLPLALQVATRRVVVKRAIHAAPLNQLKPNFSLAGKHSRFDVYTHRSSNAG